MLKFYKKRGENMRERRSLEEILQKELANPPKVSPCEVRKLTRLTGIIPWRSAHERFLLN